MSTIADRLIEVVSRAVPNQGLGEIRRRNSVLLLGLDKRLMQFALAHSLGLMRISLAIIFVWFGVLKLVLPASDFSMVIGTNYWFPLPPKLLVPILGISEILLGAAVLLAGGVLLRLALSSGNPFGSSRSHPHGHELTGAGRLGGHATP